MVQSIFTIVKKIVLIFILLVASYFFFALALSLISTHPPVFNCEKKKEIFISTNGIHLDVIIAKEDLPTQLKEDLKLELPVNYASFGWGDKGFYLETPTWNELKFSTAVKALFFNSETTIHLTRYKKKNNNWESLFICQQQMESLINYIVNSFSKNNMGQFAEISNAGYTQFDAFYEATGSYNCFKTCNNWVNIALKKAGVKTSIWSPFDKGVLHHIKNISDAEH